MHTYIHTQYIYIYICICIYIYIYIVCRELREPGILHLISCPRNLCGRFCEAFAENRGDLRRRRIHTESAQKNIEILGRARNCLLFSTVFAEVCAKLLRRIMEIRGDDESTQKLCRNNNTTNNNHNNNNNDNK